MRIAIISRSLPYVGGREVIIEHLIENLKENHTILLLTPDTKLKRDGVRVVDINSNLKTLEKVIKQFKPDVINCHTFYFFKLAKQLSVHSGVPLVTTLHGMFLRFYGKDYRSLISTICKKSDAVTVVSDSYKKELVKSLKVTPKNIFVIRNGVSPVGKPDISRKALCKKYKIPQDKKIIVVPARINKIKGLPYLAKAVTMLGDTDMFFMVCSPLGRKQNLEEQALKKELLSLGISKDILRFQEFKHSDLQDLFGICDLCLLPSLMEGISISLLEAMGMGCLVITTNVGGNSELITNGVNGYLIKSKNTKAIVLALEFFRTLSEAKKREISINAKRTIEKDFSNRRMVQSYEVLFSALAKKHEIK